VVSLSRLPDHLINAFVAGEDARFFQHKGLDYVAITRAS
jgi:penicillin-binding protein 1A